MFLKKNFPLIGVFFLVLRKGNRDPIPGAAEPSGQIGPFEFCPKGRPFKIRTEVHNFERLKKKPLFVS